MSKKALKYSNTSNTNSRSSVPVKWQVCWVHFASKKKKKKKVAVALAVYNSLILLFVGCRLSK